MLKYCSVTVKGENKEAVERIEREHVSLPRCEIKRERGVGGGGKQRRSFAGPTRHVSQPEETVTRISSISSTGDYVQDVTVNIRLFILQYVRCIRTFHRVRQPGKQ